LIKLREPISLRIVLIVYFIAVVVLYTVFLGDYQTEYLDNAWTMSWAHGWWTDGEVFDQVFGYVDGDGGTALFGRTYVFVYGAVAQVFGWTRTVGIVISSLFTVGVALIWFLIVQELGYRKGLAIAAAAVMLVLEVFYANGQKIRVDPMGLFFGSLAFLFFLRGRYFISGITLLVAIEIHPFAAAAGLWMLASLWRQREQIRLEWRDWLRHGAWFFFGASLGIVYWLLLHYPFIGDSGVAGRFNGNALVDYYFNRRMSWLHWPELLLIAAALVDFIRKKLWRQHTQVIPLVIAALVSTLTVPRANFHYVAYVYPAFVFLLLVVADNIQVLPWFLIAVLIFQLPQYAWLFYTQRSYNHRAYMDELRERVPDEPVSIYGHPSSWFAFQDREFRAYGYYGRSQLPESEWPSEFLVIENREFERWRGRADLERMKHAYDIRLLDEWAGYDDKPIRIWLYSFDVN